MLIFTLKKEWYEKIKSGEKTIEYREVKPYWERRLYREGCLPTKYTPYEYKDSGWQPSCILQLGYTKKRLEAWIVKVEIVDGKDTDLHIDKPVYAIHLADIREKKQVDLTKEISTCPYCGDVLYFHQNEFYCPDCRRAFASVTGDEIKQ